jgi:hypothetical protein
MRLLKRLSAALLVIVMASMAMLTPVLPVSAAAFLVTLSPSSGPPGTVVTIKGNFTTGSTYTLTFGLTSVVATGTVIGSGNIGTFTLPVLPRGQNNVQVTTSAGDSAKYPLPTFTVTPQIFISADTGGAGDQINVNGNGFDANQKISINFDALSVGTVTTDSQGAFPNTPVTIPQVLAGSHTTSAKDSDGSSPGLPFSIGPKLTLSVSEATVGATVSVSGAGYAASKTLTFYIDDSLVSKTATTDSSGKFANVNLVVPALIGGNHNIKIQDSLHNVGTITFLVNPSISIQPQNGPIGTKVTVTGNGFVSVADNPIVITYNGTAVVTNPDPVAADSSGYFGANFQIPAGASGAGLITVHDNFSTLTANFNSSAAVNFGTMNGPVGTVITVSGTGFKENATITFKYDNVEAGTATSDATGNFTGTFPSPPSGTGKHQVGVTDQASSFTQVFTITSIIKINETSGAVGDDISVNGTGCVASHVVTIDYDFKQIATTTTDANGTFTITFKVPVSEGGDHQITITDGTNTLTSPFTMDFLAPPIPVLISPPLLTKASSTPVLDWQDVSDPSGVTYTLQISADAKFNLLILDKEGLTSSEYQLSKQEELNTVSKEEPYYWRVKAIDGAGNEGAWSTPFTFYVGTIIPTQTYYFIVGGLVLFVGVVSLVIELIRRRR